MIFLKLESGSALNHQLMGVGVRHIPATLVNILICAKLSYIYNKNIFYRPTYRVYIILNFDVNHDVWCCYTNIVIKRYYQDM